MGQLSGVVYLVIMLYLQLQALGVVGRQLGVTCGSCKHPYCAQDIHIASILLQIASNSEYHQIPTIFELSW